VIAALPSDMSARSRISAQYLVDGSVRDPVFNFAEEAHGATSVEQLDALLARHLRRFGMGHHSFYVATDKFKRPAVRKISGTTHHEWRRHYDSNQLGAVDDLLKSGLTSNAPTTWGRFREERALNREQEDIYRQAADFGLQDGFFLPLHQPDGSMLGITMMVQNRLPTDRGTLAILHMLSLYYALAAERIGIVATARGAMSGAMQELTPRQIECLQWISEGKTSWEIGEILGLSEHTVNEHLAAARKRLGVKTTTQAAIQAVLQGLIKS
jgi:DNA-binding CsgD family transcriptional regulator